MSPTCLVLENDSLLKDSILAPGLQHSLLEKPHTPYPLGFFLFPGPQVDQKSSALMYLLYSKTPFKEDSADLRTEESGLGA